MHSPGPLILQFAGLVPYKKALDLQERLVAARIEGSLPDMLLAMEHAPVVTLGASANAAHVLRSAADLAISGVDLFATTRGGDVTYHGPGQLVIYPILKLGAAEADAHGHLANLETIAIKTAADFGVTAFRRPGMTGAWTASGKLAAIGVRFRRWVTFHGMSFNLNPDMTPFSFIVPCGLAGEAVTSLSLVLRERCPNLDVFSHSMFQHARNVLGRDWRVCSPADADWPTALRDALDAAGLPQTLCIRRSKADAV